MKEEHIKTFIKGGIITLGFILTAFLLSKFVDEKPVAVPEQIKIQEQVEFVEPDVLPNKPDKAEPVVQKRAKRKSSFDIVRVEEDGSMVAAGKGVPNTKVSLMDGEAVLTKIDINEDGEWVYIPSGPLPVGGHELWLQDASKNKREESEVVLVDVPESKNRKETVAVLLSPNAEDVKVLQMPQSEHVESVVDIKAVNYTKDAFVIQGIAQQSGRINLYMDNSFLGNVWVDKKGPWVKKLPRKLENGRKYIIRADKIDTLGNVIGRTEVPFQIEKGLDVDKTKRVRIVKGDNLWNIAKHLYGSGFAYVTIYQANKNQIKDPDLIYPNQVFVVPAKAGK